MAEFDGISLSGTDGLTAGAVLYLQAPASRDLDIELTSRAMVSTRSRSRATVVTIPHATDAETAVEESIEAAQIALDLWAIKGRMARALGDVEEEHIVWWVTEAEPTVRIWAAADFNITMSASGAARDRDGNVILAPPPPPAEWHPSFRFFRIAQATTDLIDAFRNCYLAVESLLSTIEPIKLHADGRPAERERGWLARALGKAGSLVKLTDYVSSGATSTPVETIISDIYQATRVQTFHAKAGAPVLLPHDRATREAVRGSLERLRRLYIDLAEVQFGVSPKGGGLTIEGFQGMTDGFLAKTTMYFSSGEVDESAGDSWPVPADAVSIPSKRDEDYEHDYFSATVGRVGVDSLDPQAIRHIGLLLDDVVGLYHDLEGILAVEGFGIAEIVIGIRGRNPRALGTRYKS